MIITQETPGFEKVQVVDRRTGERVTDFAVIDSDAREITFVDGRKESFSDYKVFDIPYPSAKGYKSKWVSGARNEEFWREVLVGRTITSVEFDEIGLDAFTLDDGQRVRIVKNENGVATLAVND